MRLGISRIRQSRLISKLDLHKANTENLPEEISQNPRRFTDSMQIRFQNQSFSIKSLVDCDLPNFVVITGLNGSGKTHFLRGIESGNITVLEDGQPLNTRRFFDFSTLIPQDTGVFDQNSLDSERMNSWSNVSNHIQNAKNNTIVELRQQIGEALLPDKLKNILFGQLDLSLKEDDFLSYFVETDKSMGEKMFNTFNQTVNSNNTTLKNNIVGQGISLNFSKNFEYKEKVLLINADQELYFRNFPINSPTDIFQHNLGRIFTFYNKVLNENKLKKLDELETGEKHGSLSDEEFLDRYGIAPWDFINSVFRDSKLPFTINQPARFVQGGYQPILKKEGSPDPIPFSSLSSGEKILMSFAFCLYNISAQETQTSFQKPDLILFDEIDATLHPSIAYTIVNSIVKNIVNDMGIKVIFATHSPTTISLVPEESIYQLKNSDFQHKLKKITKNDALFLLTSELPFLSISYENQRQIFVESNNDAKYYSTVSNLLKKQLNPEIFLNFISSGGDKPSDSGSSSVVIRLVNDLRSAGNKSVYGLIDWDKKNKYEDKILVSGLEKRYSLENYIYDPILFSCFLLNQGMIKYEDLKLNPTTSFSDFLSMDESILNILSENFFILLKNHGIDFQWIDLVETERISGKKISVPRDYLEKKGHDIEDEFMNRLNFMGRYKDLSKRNKIFDDIVSVSFKNLLDYLPIEILQLLKELQTIN